MAIEIEFGLLKIGTRNVITPMHPTFTCDILSCHGLIL